MKSLSFCTEAEIFLAVATIDRDLLSFVRAWTSALYILPMHFVSLLPSIALAHPLILTRQVLLSVGEARIGVEA